MHSIASAAGRRASFIVKSVVFVKESGAVIEREADTAVNGVLVGAASKESLAD